MFYFIFIKYTLSVLYLCVYGEECTGGSVSSQVRDHSGQMRKSFEALCHSAALVVDQDECHFMRMVVDSHAQDVTLKGFGLT